MSQPKTIRGTGRIVQGHKGQFPGSNSIIWDCWYSKGYSKDWRQLLLW